MKMIEPRKSEVLGALRHCTFSVAKSVGKVNKGGTDE